MQLRAAQQNPELRTQWINKLSEWNTEQLIFIDKSAANEHMADRKYSWAPVGVTPREASVMNDCEPCKPREPHEPHEPREPHEPHELREPREPREPHMSPASPMSPMSPRTELRPGDRTGSGPMYIKFSYSA